MIKFAKMAVSVLILTTGFVAMASVSLQGIKDVAALQGLYKFTGQHATRGLYTGELELRMGVDHRLMAIKKITYDTYKYEGLTVEEIWTGTAQLSGSAVELQFALRQADYLSRVQNEKRTAEQFQNKLMIKQRLEIGADALTSKLSAEAEGDFTETYSERTELPAETLWKDERHRNKAAGHTITSIVRATYFDVEKMREKIAWYRKQPEVVKLSNTQDFKDEAQYRVIDTTDFNFYQTHHNILHVPNKVVDRISLVEEMSRRNAYAYTKAQKADIFGQRMTKLNINEYGFVTPSDLDENRKFTKYGLDQDSALWTGVYIASQGMRYQVTGDPEAIANIRRCVEGMFMLMDLPTEKGEFARFVMKFDPSIKVENAGEKFEWRSATLPDGNKVNWMFGGNNDMYKGLVTAFTWAYMVIPSSDTEFHAKLESYVQRLPTLKIANSSKDNKRYAAGLLALVLNDESEAKKFVSNAKSLVEKFTELLRLDNGMYIGGMADWSGINLSMVSNVEDIVLARALSKQFPSLTKKVKQADFNAEKDMMDQVVAYQSIGRDALNVSAYALAFRTLGYSSETIQAWTPFFVQSLFRLNEVPVDLAPNDVTIDRTMSPDWGLSAYPSEPWKKDQPVAYYMQSVDSYPLFEMNAYYSSYMWKDSAFDIGCDGNTFVNMPRTDYLYMYWMARWSGLLKD